MSTPCLQIEGLTLGLPASADRRHAVQDVSLCVNAGEILCVVGESGSGKSLTAHAIMGLLPHSVGLQAGRITVDGIDVLSLSRAELPAFRGRKAGMIFQEPMTSLNPLQPVGLAIEEVFEAHGSFDRQERRRRTHALLAEVGFEDVPRIAGSYPHTLSGGQRQRVMIAMALALEPSLLIADEPTTALDVTTQAQILRLIDALRRKRGTAVLFITHDFGVVAEIADRVAVMQLGKVVEQGEAGEVLGRPQHAYTQHLLASVPGLEVPPKAALGTQGIALEVRNLRKTYGSKNSLFHRRAAVHAIDDVSFSLRKGETLGLVGESGSGKSTIGRCLVRLLRADAGNIELDGTDLASLDDRQMLAQRRRIQMVFQDPYASLNPRRKVGWSIAQGLICGGMPAAEAWSRAQHYLELVGLGAQAGHRLPHEFSGGQRQRIGIARALAVEPSVIVADEPVSALDVSVQAQVLDLLRELKKRLGIAMVFITHDLRVAAQLCDRIAVLHRGRLVEIGETADIFGAPQAAYTQRLLAAIPGR